MERWAPNPGTEPLERLYEGVGGGPGRPWLGLNMVASADGAVTVDGTSGPLGREGDQWAFRALRAEADLVLVGAGTARIEGYGPAREHSALAERRRAAGRRTRPRVGVVTRSLDLHGADRLVDSDDPPIVVTVQDADPDAVEDLRGRGATVVAHGQGSVDLAAAIRGLQDDGYPSILCEGGPRLNAGLLAAGVVDELYLTVTSMLVGGVAGRIVDGVVGDAPVALELAEARFHDGDLLLRYTVRR